MAMQDRKERAKAKIEELVAQYRRERNRGMSEADVRAIYIDWLFVALGWDVYRRDQSANNIYEREQYVRRENNGQGVGFVDVGLKVQGQPVVMLEAKRFGGIEEVSKRKGDRTPQEKQVFRYARAQHTKYTILTNFERLHLFNADHERLIGAFDSPEEYLERFEELWRLTPEEVSGGSLGWWEGQLEKKDVDLEFLKSLRAWRLTLATAIFEHNAGNPELQRNGVFDFDKLMEAVQRILDRLILMRYGDDKEVLLVHDLLENALDNYRKRGAYASNDHLMRDFIELSHQMDDQHNTTLFQADHPCEKVTIPNEVLASIIEDLSRISFRKFTSDILGNTYESYLGTKLKLVNRQIQDEERTDLRKGQGIYYTPSWVVGYIVDKTLGERLRALEQEHGLYAIEKARGLSVLDPACGSGSFLIKAYHVLADFYRRMNQGIIQEQTKLAEGFASADMFERLERLSHLPQLVVDYPQVILQEHLYGVDLDAEAAEIATVNLTMQAFADSRQKKLPKILNENIKVGNSLISGTEEELRPYFGETWAEKRPFNWKQDFPAVMGRGGFDVVLGNPPYVRTQTQDKEQARFYSLNMKAAQGNYDLYVLFLERAVSLLGGQGVLGVIVPTKFFQAEYGKGIRQLLISEASLKEIVDFTHERVFGRTATYTCLLFAGRAKSERLKFARISRLHEYPASQLENVSKNTAYVDPQVHVQELPQPTDNTPWSFLLGERGRILSKVQLKAKPLGQLGQIFVGLQTSADKIYVLRGSPTQTGPIGEFVSQVDNSTQKLELAVVRNFLTGRDIERYYSAPTHHWLLFPYEVKEGKARLLSPGELEQQYPLAWEYLNYHKVALEGRENGRMQGEKWYAFGRSQNLGLHDYPKLAVPSTVARLSACYDVGGSFYLDNVRVNGILLHEPSDQGYKYILGLLNSQLLHYCFVGRAVRFSSGYYAANRQFIEWLPIRRIDFSDATDKAMHDRLVMLVERMLELQKRMQPLRGTGLSEEQDLQREIEQTDREIDALVYELYGLTQMERRLVEDA